MEETPAHFTVGLHDGSTFAEVARTVNSAYVPLVVQVGNAQISGG